MKLPKKVCVDVEENPTITNASKRAREWCGSVVGAMVWLSSILPNAAYVFRGHADSSWNLESSLFRAKRPANLNELLKEEADLLKLVFRDYRFRQEFGFIPADGVKRTSYERTVAVLQHHGVPTRLLDATADRVVPRFLSRGRP